MAPLDFCSLGPVLALGSLCVRLTALARATASARKSLLYPFFAVELTTFLYNFRPGVEAEKEEVWYMLAGLLRLAAIFVVRATVLESGEMPMAWTSRERGG